MRSVFSRVSSTCCDSMAGAAPRWFLAGVAGVSPTFTTFEPFRSMGVASPFNTMSMPVWRSSRRFSSSGFGSSSGCASFGWSVGGAAAGTGAFDCDGRIGAAAAETATEVTSARLASPARALRTVGASAFSAVGVPQPALTRAVPGGEASDRMHSRRPEVRASVAGDPPGDREPSREGPPDRTNRLTPDVVQPPIRPRGAGLATAQAFAVRCPRRVAAPRPSSRYCAPETQVSPTATQRTSAAASR